MDQVEWMNLLGFSRIFGAFRMAVAPRMIFLAYLLVVSIYAGGKGLDLLWGTPVSPNEILVDIRTPKIYVDYPEDGSFYIDSDLASANNRGIFQTFLIEEARAFGHVINSALSLDFGLDNFLRGEGTASGGFIGGLATMFIVVPTWLLTSHPYFSLVLSLYIFLVTCYFGGAMARLAAMNATHNLRPSPKILLNYARRRYLAYALSPVIPLAMLLVIGLLMTLGGWIAFNLPGLDILGGLLFGLFLIGGFLIALLIIGLVVSTTLMPAAVAVDGCDAFDAISRAFNYAMGRPWRFVFYQSIVTAFGFITYLLLGYIVIFALGIVRFFVGLGSDNFENLLPGPTAGDLGPFFYFPHWDQLSTTGEITAILISIWVKLLLMILPAYAIAYIVSSQTWVYLLLRRAADGTGLDQIEFVDDDESYLEPSAPEKVEPQG